MLPKLSNDIKTSVPSDAVTLTCRGADGSERNYIGALSSCESVTAEVAVPRVLGTAAVVMRIFFDSDPKEPIDLPFAFSGSDGVVDTYALTLCPKMLSREGSGLYFYELIFPRGLDTLFSDTRNNVDFTLKRESGRRFKLLVYEEGFAAPAWLGGGIMYHVFVDRFCRGEGRAEYRDDAVIDPDWENGTPQYGIRPGSPVKNNVFFGGNLWGVREKLPYLASLGVGVIYLSPIFTAASNHKYDTSDYLHVDPEFGGDEAFGALLAAAHERGMRIILDGVFNHTGDDSIYFDKYRRFGDGAWQNEHSKYREWYSFKDSAELSDTDEPPYLCWWGVPVLPKLRLSEPDCRDFFVGEGGVCEKYIKMGVDGWRLDVADELPDEFLFRLRERVKAADPDAAVIGEVWENAADKISYGIRRSYFRGRQLDSVMNYPLRSALLEYAAQKDATVLADALLELYSSYPRTAADSLMNIVGTHDTARILTLLGAPERAARADMLDNREKAEMRLDESERRVGVTLLRVISAIQYAVYGFPCIYYGDERGMEGFGDPFCRMPMVSDERADAELIEHYRRLAAVRRNDVFAGGDFSVLRAEGGYIELLREKRTEQGTERVRLGANVGEDKVVMHAEGEWDELYSEVHGKGDVTLAFGEFAFIREAPSKRRSSRGVRK